MMVGTNTGSQETANRLPKNSNGAEIGVWVGDTSEKFLKRGLASLHLVDAWSPDVWFDLLPDDEQAAMLNRYSRVTGGSTRDAMVAHYDKVAYRVIERFREYDNVTIHHFCDKYNFSFEVYAVNQVQITLK